MRSIRLIVGVPLRLVTRTNSEGICRIVVCLLLVVAFAGCGNGKQKAAIQKQASSPQIASQNAVSLPETKSENAIAPGENQAKIREEASAKVLKSLTESYDQIMNLREFTFSSNPIRKEEAKVAFDKALPQFEAVLKLEYDVINWPMFVQDVKIVDGVPQVSCIAKAAQDNFLTFIFTDKDNAHRDFIANLNLGDFAIFSGTATGRFKQNHFVGEKGSFCMVYFTISDVKSDTVTSPSERQRRREEYLQVMKKKNPGLFGK